MSTSPLFEKVGECLYRNPSSRSYYALVKIRGKQIKRSLDTDSLPEARRKLRDFKNEQARIDLEAGRVTVDALCDHFTAAMSAQAPKTIKRKGDIVKRVRVKWKGVQARRIVNSNIKTLLASFKFGPPSYNLHLQTVRAVFRLALDDKWIASNPVDGIKQKKLDKPIRQTPTVAQFQSVVDSIRAQKFADTAQESADYVEFIGLAGLGQAEASAPTWRDVSFDRDQIIVLRHKTRQGFAVPIFPQLRPLLEKRYGQAKASNDGKPPSPSATVFTVANAKKAIESACDRLNLPGYTSRSFRRLFITTAIERGVDVKVIAEWQGHRDGGKLILDTYSHVRPARREQMARLMTTELPKNVIPMVGGVA
jgi:integrase